ncbi:hypothetical protein ACLWBD_00565 [Bdellovibrio sp. HCB117]|uniref:hypothetical protein n=1 Tax=Bdellovibrio sp. HCB117 TaxID=3394359 RepID=UPI0039B51775
MKKMFGSIIALSIIASASLSVAGTSAVCNHQTKSGRFASTNPEKVRVAKSTAKAGAEAAASGQK